MAGGPSAKAQIVSTLVAVFDDDRIFISKRYKERAAIIDELEHFEIKISDAGTDQYSAAPMHHDDLICSLGVATYLATIWGSLTIKMW